MIRRDEKTPTGTETQVRKRLRTDLFKVRHVYRLEEVGCLAQLFTRANEPTGASSFLRVAKTVQQKQTGTDISRHSDLLKRSNCKEGRTKAVADFLLRERDCHRQNMLRDDDRVRVSPTYLRISGFGPPRAEPEELL